MPISLRTSLLSLGWHHAATTLLVTRSLVQRVNVLSVKIEQTAKIVNATQHHVCRFFYYWNNISLHHNFTCIRGFRVCLIQLLVFSHQCIHVKVSEQIQTNTGRQDLLAYLSVRRQPVYISNSQYHWQQRLKNYRLPLFIGALKFQPHPNRQCTICKTDECQS